MIIVSNILNNMNYSNNLIYKTFKTGYNLVYKVLYYPIYGIYNIINICNLILYISLFLLYKRIIGNYNDYILKQIMNKINKCGYIVIKFTQWTTSRLLLMKNTDDNIRVIQQMEDIYENCHTHTINETNKLYNIDYNKDISEDYKILEIIGSGSIGQVYKAIDKKTDNFVAIKVKHYGIEYKYLLSYYMLRVDKSTIPTIAARGKKRKQRLKSRKKPRKRKSKKTKRCKCKDCKCKPCECK